MVATLCCRPRLKPMTVWLSIEHEDIVLSRWMAWQVKSVLKRTMIEEKSDYVLPES